MKARTRSSKWPTRVVALLLVAGTTIIAALNDDRDVRSICHRVVRLESGRLRSGALLPMSEPRAVPSMASVGAA